MPSSAERPLVAPGPALTAEQFSRYSRQLMLPGFGDTAQRRLRAARVLIIGAGGLGTAVAPVLAASGIGTLGLIDDDVVELSNLHRQLAHGVADLGRPKVDSLADAIAAIDPGCRVVRHQERVTAATLESAPALSRMIAAAVRAIAVSISSLCLYASSPCENLSV